MFKQCICHLQEIKKMNKRRITNIQKSGLGAVIGISGFIIGSFGVSLNNPALTKTGLILIAIGGIIWS